MSPFNNSEIGYGLIQLTVIGKSVSLKMYICMLKAYVYMYYCPIKIIKGLTDKGQFQYLTKLMGPQEGTYLYTT